MLTTTALAHPQRTAPASRRARRVDASRVAANAPLTRAEIAGPLSLLDRHSLAIVPEHGLALRVRSGFLWVTQDDEVDIIGTGECFIAAGTSLIVVAALETTELRFEWPSEDERLSPGLERVAPAARSNARGDRN